MTEETEAPIMQTCQKMRLWTLATMDVLSAAAAFARHGEEQLALLTIRNSRKLLDGAISELNTIPWTDLKTESNNGESRA